MAEQDQHIESLEMSNESRIPTLNDEEKVNISTEVNTSRSSEDIERQEIKYEMDARHKDFGNDPLLRLEPVFRVLHTISPLQLLIYVRLTSEHVYQLHKTKIRIVLAVIMGLLFVAYLIAAFSYRFGDEGSIRLLVIAILVAVGNTYHFIKKLYGVYIYTKHIKPLFERLRPVQIYKRLFIMVLTIAVSVAVLVFILVDTCRRRPESLVSGLGMIIFILFMFFFSKDPRQVTWRPVLWGLLLQLIFALVVLRTRWGYEAFNWLGERVTTYLGYAAAGSKFVFGDHFMDHFFAFSVMPVLIFFSATIGLLYYLGVIQVLIEKIAFIMQFSLGTGAMESLHAAINIFVGWAEALTLVRPYMDKMSISELHCVMTNGFATVAGSTLAIYILYGAPANHLLSASVMSAPAALAMAKLFYPETRANRHRRQATEKIPKMGTGIIDAASIGAVGSISIVAHILASVIAFISLLEFVNAVLQWLGDRVGLSPPDYPPLSFELICSYLFWPVVFLMGVSPKDCRVVARMVGIKTFINEFIAYEDLGKVMRNREIYYEEWTNHPASVWIEDGSSNLRLSGTNITLIGGVISPHSEMIATYALCGFSNVVALGIAIGALTVVAPSRKEDILAVAFRSLIAGCMACFLTACVAGLLGDH